MRSPLRILHLEDNSTDADLIAATLHVKKFPCVVTAVATQSDFEEALRRELFDVILSDYAFPSFDGMKALKIAQATCPDVPFIFVTGALGEELAIETLKCGVTDYVLNDRLSRLIPAITRAVQEAENRERRRQAEEALTSSGYKLRLLTENIRDAVFSYDTARSIQYVNPAFQILTGYTIDELY